MGMELGAEKNLRDGWWGARDIGGVCGGIEEEHSSTVMKSTVKG